MRETIRLWPLVLLALFTWVVTGCDSNAPTASADPSPVPGASSATPTPLASGTDKNDVAGRIGRAEITREQLTERLLTQYGKQTLREMMLAAAVDQEAEALRLTVTANELERQLTEMRQGYASEAEFYEAMRDQLGMSEEDVRGEARYRLLTEKLSLVGVVVDDAEIDRYIAEHPELTSAKRYFELAQIVVGDEQTAEGLLAQLENGVAFGALAERYSADEFTAAAGGDLGWVEDRDPFIDADVLSAAAELEVGDVTGPIETGNGYVLLALNGRRQEDAPPPEAVREEARRQAALGKALPMREVERRLMDKYGAEVLDERLR